MRVFVAGAAGAIGRQLISLLVGTGHDVTGTTRSTKRAEWLASAGAHPIIVDAYDRNALRAAVADARPNVVVHELTDLARGFDAENIASSGRLREVGTRNLVDAAVAAGAGRLVAQSGAWVYADGPLPHDESHPLRDPTDSPDVRGILELERVVMGTDRWDRAALRLLLPTKHGMESRERTGAARQRRSSGPCHCRSRRAGSGRDLQRRGR